VSSATGVSQARRSAARRILGVKRERPLRPPAAAGVVQALEAGRRAFGPQAATTTARALDVLARVERLPVRLLRRAHDALLFIATHPASRDVHVRAERELQRMPVHVRRLAAKFGETSLDNTGLPGTALATTFSLALTEALVARYPGAVELLEIAGEPVLAMAVLRTALDPVEQEQLSEETLRLGAWLDRYAGKRRDARLRGLLRLGRQLRAAEPLREAIFSALRVFVRWRLGDQAPSLALARAGTATVFVHDAGLERLPALTWRHLAQPTTSVALSPGGRAQLAALAQGVLATQFRETDPITYAHAAETELHDLGRGIQIALFYMRAEHKLALETYACYLLFKNRIPVAYGGGWALGPQCRFGVNVLPPFRGGESTLLVAALLRLYADRFGARLFAVEPYQIGKGNPDGIRSASFWFYYRLGFRPAQSALAALAADEFGRLSSGVKTTPAVLRALAESLLVWRGGPRSRWRYVSPAAPSRAMCGRCTGVTGAPRHARRRAVCSRDFREGPGHRQPSPPGPCFSKRSAEPRNGPRPRWRGCCSLRA
jgi:hypothetical protein